MLAAMHGDAVSAEALLKAGANPNRPGSGRGHGDLDCARAQNAAMVNLLQRYGGK